MTSIWTMKSSSSCSSASIRWSLTSVARGAFLKPRSCAWCSTAPGSRPSGSGQAGSLASALGLWENSWNWRFLIWLRREFPILTKTPQPSDSHLFFLFWESPVISLVLPCSSGPASPMSSGWVLRALPSDSLGSIGTFLGVRSWSTFRPHSPPTTWSRRLRPPQSFLRWRSGMETCVRTLRTLSASSASSPSRYTPLRSILITLWDQSGPRLKMVRISLRHPSR